MQLRDALAVGTERIECMRNGGGGGKWNKEGSAHGLTDEMGCVCLKERAKKKGKYKK